MEDQAQQDPPRERLVVEIPADVKTSLRVAAAQANRDQWQIVTEALRDYFARQTS